MKTFNKAKVIDLCKKGIDLLSKYRVKWVYNLIEIKRDLEIINDPKELQKFLKENERQIVGGMGSLLDVYISSENENIADDFKLANKEVEQFAKQLIMEWSNLQKSLM